VDKINKRLKIQEAEYIFPYHYIPSNTDGGFSQTKYWSWGYRYLGGIKVVSDQIAKYNFDSLIDIGCGDGRFLAEIGRLYPNKNYCGIDYSKRAINLAKAFNPHIDYQYLNILEEKLSEKYDIATAIEVLEHIPASNLDKFIDRIVSCLKANSTFILTVPHKNVPLESKHYQHFSINSISKILDKHFSKISIIPFDPSNKIIDYLFRLLGGNGNYYILTHKRLLSFYFNLYINNYLYANDETDCLRLCAVCHT